MVFFPFASRTILRLADRNGVVAVGNFLFNAAIKIFVLEEDAGIVVANGGLDESLGVVGRRWANDLEAWRVDEVGLWILRVERAAVNVAAAWSAKNDWSGRTPAIVRLGEHVGDLVEGTADEVHELEFSNRAHACKRSSERRANDGHFRDRRIDDALGPKVIDEAFGNFERAAVDTDVLADAKDGGIALHFFPDALANGFEISQLHKSSR